MGAGRDASAAGLASGVVSSWSAGTDAGAATRAACWPPPVRFFGRFRCFLLCFLMARGPWRFRAPVNRQRAGYGLPDRGFSAFSAATK